MAFYSHLPCLVSTRYTLAKKSQGVCFSPCRGQGFCGVRCGGGGVRRYTLAKKSQGVCFSPCRGQGFFGVRCGGGGVRCGAWGGLLLSLAARFMWFIL